MDAGTPGWCRACGGPCCEVGHVARLPGYAVEAVLGRGGFGVVVRARGRGRGGAVAIKIAHRRREACDRLARERAALAAVGPPLVPALLDHGASEDGSPFLVMELIEAPTLRARIAQGGDPLAVARSLAAAIAALHARGFIHRDIKPDNAFALPDRVVLVDLGLARPVGAVELTATGVATGTAIYAAPEQLAGAAVTAASDVYALGAVLYELATGRPPFTGGDGEIRVAHHSRRPVPPRELAPIDAALDAVIIDCLAKQPASRPTAAEVVARLARTAGPGAAQPAAPARRSRVACGVVIFESSGAGAAVAELAELVAGHQGELAGIVDGCWAAVFSAVDAARPDARAVRGARALVDAGLAVRAVVERRELVVRTRAGGGWQVMSNLHVGARARLAGVARGGVVVVDGAGRAGAMSQRPPWEGAPVRALPPLDGDEAARLCRELLRPAIDVPDAAIARLTAHAGGNPRRLVELCRSLHAIGAVRPRARRGDHYLDAGALDEALAAAARGDCQELAALDPALLACAGALALLAPGFAAGDAIAILERTPCDRFPLDPGVALDRLRRRGLIDGDGALRFPGAVAAAALAAALAPDAARQVHAAAAAHFEDRLAGSGGGRGWLARLAPHVAALGDGDRAAAMLVELAGRVRDDHDYLAAEAWYGRALDLVRAPAVELAARRGRAAMRHRLGRHEDAVADLEHGRALARAAGDRALEVALLLDEATALDWTGEVQRSAARLDQARALVGDPPIGDPPWPALRVRLVIADGRRAWRATADAAAAAGWLERGLAGAAALGDELHDDRIAAMVMLVFLLPALDRVDDAERIAADAIAICEQRGDRHHLMAVLNNRQIVSLRRGLVERAIADLERAEQLGRELGMPFVRYTTRLSLGHLHRRIGDPAAAERHARVARLAETEGSAAGARQSAAILLLQILAAQGEVAAARGLLAEIRRDGLHEEEVAMLGALALALADADDAAGWDALIDGLGAARALVPDVLEQRALAAHRRGEPAAARRYLAAALDAARSHDPVAQGRLARALEAMP